MGKKDNYDSVMQLLGRKRNSTQEIHILAPEASGAEVVRLNVSSSNEFIQLDNEEFNYNILDKDLGYQLRQKESTLKNIFANAYTNMGEVLKEAQDLLASHNKNVGVFEAWYTSLGFKKDTVYRLISRFDLLANCEKKERDLLESIPLSLAYELSKSSCPECLKKAVLAGEIRTLKEFKQQQNDLSLRENPRLTAVKTYTKKDIQLKKARLLEEFHEFQKKSNLSTNDSESMASLMTLLAKAENTLASINEMLE